MSLHIHDVDELGASMSGWVRDGVVFAIDVRSIAVIFARHRRRSDKHDTRECSTV